MKKAIAMFLAFLIVSAFVAGFLYLLGYVLNCPSMYADGNAVTVGLGCGLAGLLGPIIAAYVSKKNSKK